MGPYKDIGLNSKIRSTHFIEPSLQPHAAFTKGNQTLASHAIFKLRATAQDLVEPEKSKDDVETLSESASSDTIILDQVPSKQFDNPDPDDFDQDDPDSQVHDLHKQEQVHNDNEKSSTPAFFCNSPDINDKINPPLSLANMLKLGWEWGKTLFI